MNKLFVAFLSVLVGSIMPVENYTLTENLFIIMGALCVVILEIIFSHKSIEYSRYVSIFFLACAIGIILSLIFEEWSQIAKTIILVVFVIGVIFITATIGIREERVRKKHHNQKQEEEE